MVNPSLSSDGSEYLLSKTPWLNFAKEESFGYSLNGKEFFVPEGGSYTKVKDSFRGTTARILGGTNTSTATDSEGRKLTKDVTTGWARDTACDDLASNELTLWGLSDVGARRATPTRSRSATAPVAVTHPCSSPRTPADAG